MPNLTQIELPTGSVYDIVDQGARNLIAALHSWEYVVCTSAANTPEGVTWQSGSTTVTGTLVAASTTMYKIYLVPTTSSGNDSFAEYITINTSGTTYNWEMFGSVKLPDMTQYVKNKSGHTGGTAGDLAYKDSASGSGTVAVPKTYTTSVSTATTESKSVSVSGTTTGSVSVTKSAVEITPATTGTAANKYKPAGTNSSSSVSGSCSVTPSGTISVGNGTANYTPAGTNSSSSVSGSCSVTPSGTISVGTGTVNYTPAGSVTVKTAGSTTIINNPTSKTVVTDMAVADPSSTAATGELVYCSVSGTKLTLKKFVETTGASISTSSVTVKNGDAAYQFGGTGAELKFTGSSSSGTISGTAAAQTFTGTGKELKFTGSASSGTISGTAAAQTFTGTDTYFKTASDVATGASFTGASMTSTGSVDVPKTYSASTTTATTENKTVSITVS